MTPVQFAYWLQSAFELSDAKSFDEKQTAIIRNHLKLVFVHIDGEDNALDAEKTGLAPEDVAAIKQAIHDGKKRPPPSGFGRDTVLRC